MSNKEIADNFFDKIHALFVEELKEKTDPEDATPYLAATTWYALSIMDMAGAQRKAVEAFMADCIDKFFGEKESNE